MCCLSVITGKAFDVKEELHRGCALSPRYFAEVITCAVMAEISVSTCRINWEMIFVKSIKVKCTSVVLSHLIRASET